VTGRWSRRVVFAAGGLVLAACGHEQPFRPGTYGPDGPFNPSTLYRLTLNPLDDRTPAWTPDGTGIWYAVERNDRRDLDHCLGRLPPAGGARVETRCHVTVPAEDSTDVLEGPSPASDGRLAYVHVNGRIGSVTPYGGQLAVAPADAGEPQVVLRLPSLQLGRRGFDRATQVRWLGGDTLVFVGELWIYVQNDLAGIRDTIETGVGIETIVLGAARPERVPDTDWASSVAIGDTAGVLYYTLNGESRVMRRRLASGDTATVYDFGTLGITRDVQVRAGRLVAVVGGSVTAGWDANLGALVQNDEGGFLYWVDLATGVRGLVSDSARFRRPALSPDGRRIVAEVRGPGGSDLWLAELP